MAYPYTFVPIDENAQRFMCLVDLSIIFPIRPTIAKLLNEAAILVYFEHSHTSLQVDKSTIMW